MLSRLAPAALVVALVAGLATGCFAQPEPEPTPVFETEEEAFAAAEETYRAYVDALNQVDLSEPETFEDMYEWTTGDLNASDRKNFSDWHAEGYTKSGAARIGVVDGVSSSSIGTADVTVELAACYDVSAVDVLDKDGASLVSEDRPDLQNLSVALVGSASTPTRLAVAAINPLDGEQVC